MKDILACVDASSYAASVCDHAAWFAERIEAPIRVLHVDEDDQRDAAGPPAESGAALRAAIQRLRDDGAEQVTGETRSGELASVAAAMSAELIVMGKRGEANDQEQRPLGAHVDAMIRATSAPICLTSKVFLPVGRALVLVDADMSHRTAVEFVASHRGLHDLEIDVVVAAPPDAEVEAKVAWARSALAAREVQVFALQAHGLSDAVEQYVTSRRADLIIVSRAVLAMGGANGFRRLEERGIWGWRTPVLVC